MKLTPIMRKVKGIAGSAKATYHRTVKWKIEDDNNIVHIHHTKYILHHQCTDKDPIATTFCPTDAGSQTTCRRNWMHNYEHHNSPILEPKEVRQDSQTRFQAQHRHDEYSPGNKTI